MGGSTVMALKNVNEQCCPPYIDSPLTFPVLFVITTITTMIRTALAEC